MTITVILISAQKHTGYLAVKSLHLLFSHLCMDQFKNCITTKAKTNFTCLYFKILKQRELIQWSWISSQISLYVLHMDTCVTPTLGLMFTHLFSGFNSGVFIICVIPLIRYKNIRSTFLIVKQWHLSFKQAGTVAFVCFVQHLCTCQIFVQHYHGFTRRAFLTPSGGSSKTIKALCLWRKREREKTSNISLSHSVFALW